MLTVRVVNQQLHLGQLVIAFHRTLRIPDDGRDYPLPPSLGHFPLHRVEDCARTVPAAWTQHGGVFLPMYQREALWLSFTAPDWRPMALKVALGMVNALTGKPWAEGLSDTEQDYLVCPPQPWLDGLKTESDIIRQFVAMPLGMGYTAEGQITGQERFGGLQLLAYPSKPGRFPDRPPRSVRLFAPSPNAPAEADYGPQPLLAGMAIDAAISSTSTVAPRRLRTKGAEMGLGAGGRMKQAIYPDQHGIDTWDQTTSGRVYVHLVNSMMYREITGCEPPPTPVDAHTYTKHGYPWFDLYDEHLGDLPGSEILKGVRSVKQMDADKGFQPQQDDETVDVPKVVTYGVADPHTVRDGAW
jgi:hypothetical protein